MCMHPHSVCCMASWSLTRDVGSGRNNSSTGQRSNQQNLMASRAHHNTYSQQLTSICYEQFFSFCTARHKVRMTDTCNCHLSMTSASDSIAGMHYTTTKHKVTVNKHLLYTQLMWRILWEVSSQGSLSYDANKQTKVNNTTKVDITNTKKPGFCHLS